MLFLLHFLSNKYRLGEHNRLIFKANRKVTNLKLLNGILFYYFFLEFFFIFLFFYFFFIIIIIFFIIFFHKKHCMASEGL